MAPFGPVPSPPPPGARRATLIPPSGADDIPEPGPDAAPLRSDGPGETPVPLASPMYTLRELVEPAPLDAGAPARSLGGGDGAGPAPIAAVAADAGARAAVSGEIKAEGGGLGVGAGAGVA